MKLIVAQGKYRKDAVFRQNGTWMYLFAAPSPSNTHPFHLENTAARAGGQTNMDKVVPSSVTKLYIKFRCKISSSSFAAALHLFILKYGLSRSMHRFIIFQHIIYRIHPQPCIDKVTMLAEAIVLSACLNRFTKLLIFLAVPRFF